MSEIKVMKRGVPRIFIYGVLFLLVLAGGGYQIMTMQYQPMDTKDTSFQDIIIPENSTASQVAEVLAENDLIRNEAAFLTYCRQQDLDSSLKAGHYIFSRSQSLPEIARAIAAGAVVTVSFTVPEGYTVNKIGELLAKKGICSMEAWQKALQADYNYDFLPDAASYSIESRLEGFLFPDTYIISEDTGPEKIIKAMLANFAAIWEQEFAALAEQKKLSVNETVVLASMIEREAMVADERPIISGVIHNRLGRGMLLQIDATVLYVLGDNDKRILYYEDLKIDSPYNTYLYPGLPPAPIACPGKAALKAALNPEQNDYLYYVARGDGSHEFNRSYEAHLQAKSKYID